MIDKPPATPSIFDTLILPEDADTLPHPNPYYHVVSRDGIMVYKQTLFGRVLVPVDEATHLPKTTAILWKNVPPIPTRLLGQVWSFFRAVFEDIGTEAMVYLTFKDGEYRVFVPKQENTAGHVDAKLDPTHIQRGWKVAGTIHSHCNFGAFHSGTDTHDADSHDGLHITVGHVDSDNPQFAVMLSFNKIRWDIKLRDVTTDAAPPLTAHPAWWHRYVSKATSTTTSSKWLSGTTGYGHDYGWHGTGYAPRAATPTPTVPADRAVTSLPDQRRMFSSYSSAGDAVDDMIRLGYTRDPEDQQDADDWLNGASELDGLLSEVALLADDLGLVVNLDIDIDPTAMYSAPRSVHTLTDAEWIEHHVKELQ